MMYWGAGAAIALAGILGLWQAARTPHDGLYIAGLVLFAACIVAIMGMIRQRYDGVPDRQVLDIWPRRPRNGWVLLAVLGILGLGGLVIAASDRTLSTVGLSLFLVACIMGFLTLRKTFDRMERHR